MLADDVQQRRVWKSLFVHPNRCRRVHSGEDCRLARCALRPALDAEACIRCHDDAVIDNCRGRASPCPIAGNPIEGSPTGGSHEGCPYNILLENSEWFRVAQSVEWIVRPPRTNPEPVDKEEQNGRGLSCHRLCRARVRGRDIRSACCAESWD